MTDKGRNEKGQFNTGNKLWQLRDKDGRNKIFSSPHQFRDEAEKYFEWVNKNPWIKKEAIKSGEKAGELVDIPTQRPYTLEGLCNYLGITFQTYLNYEKDKNYSDFFDVFAYVRKLIEEQQLSGAFSGAFNPMIAARKLGLQESQRIRQENVNYNTELSKGEIKDIASELEGSY